MRKWRALFAPIPAAIAIAACSAAPEKAEILAVLHRQTAAINKEDLKAYMATFDPQAPNREATQNATELLFEKFRLNTWVEQAKILRHEGDRASVRATIVTKRVEGDAFRNNRTTATHELHKIGGIWHVVSTKTENVEFLP